MGKHIEKLPRNRMHTAYHLKWHSLGLTQLDISFLVFWVSKNRRVAIEIFCLFDVCYVFDALECAD